MSEQAKTITPVKALHLTKKGYGPEGQLTRREWRTLCLERLNAGKEAFVEWQQTWQVQVLEGNEFKADFSAEVRLEDGSVKSIGDIRSSYCLDFVGQTFSLELNADSYNFLITADFSHATFEEDTRFDGAVFSKDAWFDGATFEGDTWFDGATFEGDTWFDGATFEGDAWFGGAAFTGIAGFFDAEFAGYAFYQSTIFKSVGHFEGARFDGGIPAFRACKIGDTRLEFSDDSHFTQADFTEEAIKNISFLKRLSDEHGQTDQALNFNAMELRAKRKLAWQQLFTSENNTNNQPQKNWLFKTVKFFTALGKVFSGQFWFCVFTYLYEAVSDFGRSFTRPLKWLLGLMVVSWLFGLVAATETNPCKAVGTCTPIFAELNNARNGDDLSLSGYRTAFEYGVLRAGNFDFMDTDKHTEAINQRLFDSKIEPWWARLFGLIKGFLTLLLLFLTGLGLRNKYRVG